MDKTKKALLACGFRIGGLILLLLGTSLFLLLGPLLFKGNKVRAGNLRIEAFAYEQGADGGVNLDTQRDLSEDPIPIISGDGLGDGKSRVKYLEVRNKGDVAAKVNLDFKVTEEKAQDDLWYDFSQVDDHWNDMGEASKRPMSTLSSINKIYVYTLEPQQVLRLKLEFGSDKEAASGQTPLEFEADAVVHVSQVGGMDKLVRVYDAVDFFTRNDHPTYVLMRSISGDVQLNGLADIDLNGYTINGNLIFGSQAPIQTAGVIHIGSASGGAVTGKVTVNAPNAEVSHYGVAGELWIRNCQTYRVYGDIQKQIYMEAGALFLERDASTGSLRIPAKVSSLIRISNDGVIRELHAPVENAGFAPHVTGNTPQTITQATKADVSGATGWDGELLTEPEQKNGAYAVSTAAQLAWLSDKVNKGEGGSLHVRLDADIDMNRREWTPIGRDNAFSGEFDGQGHTISRLQITDEAQFSGLFGMVKDAVIKNVTVDDASLIEVSSYAGGLVGKSMGSRITNCHVRRSAITAAVSSVGIGGLAGFVEAGPFEAVNCSVTDTGVTGYFNIGGLLGSCQAAGGQKLVLDRCTVYEVTVTASPYHGDIDAWKGKFIQTHRFIGRAQADKQGASITLRGCKVNDSEDNGSTETYIGDDTLKDWMARGIGDIRIVSK